MYDEPKRFGEAAVTAFREHSRLNTGIVRIFNTYRPRMRADDGRVVPALITRALERRPLTIHGSGLQTRSFCYVDDLIRGLILMLRSDEAGPINLGNPEELTILDLMGVIVKLTGADANVEALPPMRDDPTRRMPDISAARRLLGWAPEVPLEEGIGRTIRWFARERDPGATPLPARSGRW